MQFFAVNGKRPERLSEETRTFAFESLNHKYGQDTLKKDAVVMDDVEDFDKISDIEKYDAAIARIVKEAPVRICKNEKISGAATLGRAIKHNVPALYKGEPLFWSVSHLTIDFKTVLKRGVDGILEDVQEAQKKYKGTEKEAFILSCIKSIDSMKLWHKRYIDELEKMQGYEDNYNNLKNVPFGPAKSFYEAVQSIWFVFSFVRLCGNWPGIGRIDYLLGEYLEKDLSEGVLTLDEAREILAHFFIKGCEWICGGDYCSGDAQHYQNIILGGIDENGHSVTNKVTYLVLDVLEELGISDFPTTVRISGDTDKKLLFRVAEVIRLGGGVVAVYNEDLIIKSLVDYGYDLKEARNFANDGCWEVQIPGKTYFTYIPFDALQILQKTTLKNYGADFDDFNTLYSQYVSDLKGEVENLIAIRSNNVFSNTEQPIEEWKWKKGIPCTVISLFEEGCIEKGCSYFEGGPVYNVVSPHIGGLPDVVNSLYAIKRLVFDECRVTFSELMKILKNDWADNEPLRQYALNKYDYFGNDNDEVDSIAQMLVKDFSDICDCTDKLSAYKTPAGISTFGRQLEWAPHRFATPYGKKAMEVLSGNFSPTPGTDKKGATAIIKSYCKADLTRTVSGAALDIKLLPADADCETVVSLIKGFVALGGHFMQLDVVDSETLKDAQEHPENYQNLSVRVSGWNARFVTLSKKWQDMIIAQTGSENN